MAKAPLEGIRVASFGWVWAGPVVGQTLSFLGAEVYKIESNARMDISRALDLSGLGLGIAPPMYTGQGSVTINLKSEEGRELIKELVSKSDVVVENFGAGVLDNMGLDYESLKAVKEDIIMVSMPTAGNSGPLKDVRSYGVTVASLCGFDAVTGYPNQAPSVFETPMADPYNGILSCFGVICALHHREKTGEGQFIDYSQQEAVVQMLGPVMMDYFMNGRNQARLGNRTPNTKAAPHGCFRCKGEDRWISIACFTDEEWRGLVTAMGNPAWTNETQFATLEDRIANIDALNAHITAWTTQFEHYSLTETLQSHGVAAAPVTDNVELATDPHVLARNLWIENEHKPDGIKAPVYNHYVQFSKSKQPMRPAPMLGEDNDYVFKEVLGFSEDKYQQLKGDKAIF